MSQIRIASDPGRFAAEEELYLAAREREGRGRSGPVGSPEET